MRPRRRVETGQKYPKAQRQNKAAFFSLSEEREFVVDSGASMHMLSRKDLNSAEFETVRVSENPITVVTANGEVQTRESDGICQTSGLVCPSYAF